MSIENDQPIMEHDEGVAARLQRLVQSDAYVYMRQNMLEMIITDRVMQTRQTIYDVGCGEGAFCRDVSTAFNLQAGSKIIGVDSSPAVLEIAKNQEIERSEATIEYVLGSVLDLPLEDDSADTVVFANTLKYLKTKENEQKATEELLRVIKPGGRLLIVDGNDIEIEYRGGKADLNKKAIAAYASLQGNEYAGSGISDLCRSIRLRNIEERLISLRETEFTPHFAGYAMAQNICSVLVDTGTMDRESAKQFFRGLEVDAAQDAYAWRYDKYMVAGEAQKV